MVEYNLFLEQNKIKEDSLFIIKQIQYWKSHNFSDELTAKKLKLEYIDWIEKFEGDPESFCGHFTLGTFGSHDIEINFAILRNSNIGFEVCLSKEDSEIQNVLIYNSYTYFLYSGKYNFISFIVSC